MASIIKLKRSTTAAAVPSSLELGEVAVNLFDRKLYVGNSTGVTAVGGEQFRLTTQNSDEGALLKIFADTPSFANSILLEAGTDLDITNQANGSVLFELEDTISSNTTGTAATASALTSAVTVTLTGDTTGTATFTSAGDTASISTTIADASISGGQIAPNSLGANTFVAKSVDTVAIADGAITSAKIAASGITANAIGNDSVALGTKTTGNYVATVADAGAGDIVVSGSGSETASVTLDLADQISSNTSGTAALADAMSSAVTVTLSGDVAGTATFTNAGDTATITTTIQADSVALGTDTTGDYVGTIQGTANEIAVTGAGTEDRNVTIGLPTDVTVQGQLDVGENVVVTGNTSIGGDLQVAGNLDVTGAVTYLSSSTVNVDDSMLKLSANNVADVTDHGVYAQYVEGGTTKWAGYFRDASDSSIFKFYTDVEVEPTTTVDITAAGYAQATLEATIDGGTY